MKYNTNKDLTTNVAHGFLGLLAYISIMSFAQAGTATIKDSKRNFSLSPPQVVISELTKQPQPLGSLKYDLNGDEKLDILKVSAEGIRYFEREGKGFNDRGLIFEASYQSPNVDTDLAIGDLNNDGEDELVFIGPAGLDVLVCNEELIDEESPFDWEGENSSMACNSIMHRVFGTNSSNVGTSVQLLDLDKDGDLDIYATVGGKGLEFYNE